MATTTQLANLSALFGYTPSAEVIAAVESDFFSWVTEEFIADALIDDAGYTDESFLSDFASDVLGADHPALASAEAALQNLAANGLSNAEIAIAALDYLLNAGDADYADVTAELVAAADAILNPAAVSGDDYMLTAGTDVVTGTADNDMFMAYLSQNSFSGGVSNTLSSADVIDGGDGVDTLEAVVTSEFVGAATLDAIDIQPTTTSVENVTFEARDTAVGSNGAVYVDAKRMTDVVEIGSSYSDADLVIENLTTLTESGAIRNTRDMTITMDHTEGQNSSGTGSDLTVYFDEDYLNTTTEVGGSTLLIRLVNNITNVTTGNPIFGTAGFSIEVGAEQVLVDLSEIGADETLDFTTAYDEVVAAINAAMVEAGFTTVTAAVQPLAQTVFSIPVTAGGVDYGVGDSAGSYYPILVTNTGEEELGQGSFSQADVAEDVDINSSMTPNAGSETELPIEINIELDKVGRDGEGGALVIGGKDQNGSDDGEEDQNDGFNIFNVFVQGNADQPSNLEYITSTDQALDTINIANGDEWTGASLEIREAFNGGQDNANWTNLTNIETVNADGFSGDLTIGNGGGVFLVDRMLNVDDFSAIGGGDIEVWANITGDEKGQFSMTTGAGADTLDVLLDGDAVDTVGTSFAAATGAGADTVNVSMQGGWVSHNTTEDLDNLSIETGDGADSILLVGGSTGGLVVNAGNPDGDANFNISAGADSDFVRIESGADIDSSQFIAGNPLIGSWMVGAVTEDQPWVDRVLYNATLTVNFAGFEQQVTIATTQANNFVATQLDINTAVKAAIDANPELSRLLSYTDGTASQSLEIVSTVEGNNDLTIAVNQPTVAAASITGTVLTAMQAGLIETGAAADSDLVDTAAEIKGVFDPLSGNLNEFGTAVAAPDLVLDTGDGNDGDNETTVTNYSVIDMGTGANDLVALNSDVDSVNTVDFNEVWGKVSIVNWFVDQADTAGNDVLTDAATGNHVLDFTFWLDDLNTLSTSTVSQTREATSFLADNAGSINLDSNQVSVISDFAQVSATAGTWAGMTADNLDAALEGTTAYGNIVTGATSAVTLDQGTLVGTSIDSIIMIENDLNAGEYKVFNVETANAGTATDSFTVTLLGVVDFGESIDNGLSVANFA